MKFCNRGFFLIIVKFIKILQTKKQILKILRTWNAKFVDEHLKRVRGRPAAHFPTDSKN